MKIVACDANIIIDLLQVDLFLAFLELDWEKHMSSLAEGEVQEENSYQLNEGIHAADLIFRRFSPEELDDIQNLKENYPPLSLADCSCLYLAECLGAILLTGERKLRKVAIQKHQFEVHGILWVMEKLIENRIITYRLAHNKLTSLRGINRRLPVDACLRLLRRWKRHF